MVEILLIERSRTLSLRRLIGFMNSIFKKLIKYILKKIPISLKNKKQIKNFIFRRFGFFFKKFAVYKIWLELNALKADMLGDELIENLFTFSDGKKILVIDSSTPMPDKDAGSVTAWYFLKAFIDLGYDVTFIPYDLEYKGTYTENIRSIGIRCVTCNEIDSIEVFLSKVGNNYDYALLYRVHTASAVLPLIKRYVSNAKIIFDTVDLHYIRERREALLSKDSLRLICSESTKNSEFELMRYADATIVLSEVEKNIVLYEDSQINVVDIPLLLDVPGSKNGYDARRDIVFIGGFMHQPNVDAIKYFVDEIWPIISLNLDSVKLIIIGSYPNDEIYNLSKNDNRIEVVGYVENLDGYFNNCRLTVVPLRYGAGIKGKIGTSASFGVPSVATTVAVEGMGLIDHEHIMVADTPEDFAAAVLEIYSNKKLWEKISSGCLDFVKTQYSYELGKNKLKNLLEGLGDNVGN